MSETYQQQICEIPFFFIIGRPRSGTTLLRTVLDAHPHIKIPPEYPVIPELYNKYRRIRKWDHKLIRQFLSDYKSAQPADIWKYEYLRINEDDLAGFLNEHGSEMEFTGLIKAIYYHYQSLFEKQDIRLLGDKNPFYAPFMKRLIMLFPLAKFVFITRDYRDNFLSIRKFGYEAPNVILQSYRWKYVVRQFLELSSKHSGQFLHVRYEDLASQPEITITAVCRFLGVSFDPVMTEYHQKAHMAYDPATEKEFMRFHEGLTKPISDAGLYNWKNRLDRKAIRKADATVGSCAEKMGYHRQFTKTGLLTQLIILPWRLYAYSLYKAMNAAEYLPYRIRKRLAKLLPYLSKIYHRLFA